MFDTTHQVAHPNLFCLQTNQTTHIFPTLTPLSQLKFTLQGTNTYLLGRGPSRLLIDTAQGEKAWLTTLSTVLKTQNAKITTCLLTHWHHDHIGGVKDLLSLPDHASVHVHKHLPTHNPDGILDPESVSVREISDGQKFSIPPSSNNGGGEEGGDGVFEIQAIHTPGHAKDHMAFQITRSSDVDEVGSIFTADNVLGHGTAVFEDLATYLDSLALMKRRVVESVGSQSAAGVDSGSGNGKPTRIKRAYPGHGAVIDDAVAKIDEYIHHRRMREQEALNVLRYGTVKAVSDDADVEGATTTMQGPDSITMTGDSDGDGDDGGGSEPEVRQFGKEVALGKEWASMDMVKVIYRHYPESLYQPAEYGLLMVLEKLRGDGKVVKTAEGRWRVSEKAIL
jgi:glyoxylase-like metal-dependent hydrolase (beta-lactamase superfamily II)